MYNGDGSKSCYILIRYDGLLETAGVMDVINCLVLLYLFLYPLKL